MKTFSQSVTELSNALRGRTFTARGLTGAARMYLRSTGTPEPSHQMIEQLADAVYATLMGEKGVQS